MAKRIGFVGLGVMGRPMALNLVKAGHQLTVFDIEARAIESLVEAGARAAGTAREAAQDQDVVVSMLPSSSHVDAAYLGPDGVVEGLAPNAVAIDMSTIDPVTSRRIADEVLRKGARMLDAPVSGSSAGATEGTLTIMVGGDEEVLESHRDIFLEMGRNVIYCGANGMGLAVKLCNNLVAGASMVAVAEAFALGHRLGVDARVLFDVMSKSSGNCWVLQTRPPIAGLVPGAPSGQDFAPGFMVDLMHKDLGLVMASASEVRLPLAVAAAAQQVFALASLRGYGRNDFSAVFRVLERTPADA